MRTRWRAGARVIFEGAATCLAQIAGDDPPAALFLARARELAQHPPGPDWEAVCNLEGK